MGEDSAGSRPPQRTVDRGDPTRLPLHPDHQCRSPWHPKAESWGVPGGDGTCWPPAVHEWCDRWRHREDEGGGVVQVERGQELERLSVLAGRYCISFSAETAALLAALRWMRGREGWITVALITDSMSLLQAIQEACEGCRMGDIRRICGTSMTRARRSDAGTRRNEAADEIARRGSELPQEGVGSIWQRGWMSPGGELRVMPTWLTLGL